MVCLVPTRRGRRFIRRRVFALPLPFTVYMAESSSFPITLPLALPLSCNFFPFPTADPDYLFSRLMSLNCVLFHISAPNDGPKN